MWIIDKLHSTLLKLVIFANIDAKAAIYLPLTVFLSLVTDMYPLPDTYFNYKDNILNRGFMKINHIWCALVLLPFAIIISYVYSRGNIFAVIVNTLRTIIAISACQIIRRLLFGMESWYDHCDRNASFIKSENECTLKGYNWTTFQLSGHTYYLFYYSLVSMEEARLYTIWLCSHKIISEMENLEKSSDDTEMYSDFSNDEFMRMKKIIISYNNFLKLWIIFIGVYVVIADFCTITTLIYFHEIDEKLCGSILAIATWYLVYKLFFSKFIRRKIYEFCNEDELSLFERFNKEWYSFEVRRLDTFKTIQHFVPFLQPNFNI